MIRRPDNWPELLPEAHLSEWDSKPFSYGDADCVSFAASWLSRLGYADRLPGSEMGQRRRRQRAFIRHSADSRTRLQLNFTRLMRAD